MIFSREELGNFESSIDKQWVVSNGLGGYASSTITGTNTSKYHGLLFAALRPPGERTLLLAKLDDEIEINGSAYALGSNHTGTGVFPSGYLHLQSFELRPYPTYTYAIMDTLVEKVIFMIRETNTTVVRYTIYAGRGTSVKLKVTPFVNCRHYHHTTRKNDWPFNSTAGEKDVLIEAYPGAPKLNLYSDKALYVPGRGYWFEGLFYSQEDRRGLDPWEDHFMPGHFEIELVNGETFAITASTDGEKPVSNPLLEQVGAERRLVTLVEQAGFQEEFTNRLILAADSFIVNRESTGAKTIIAGYPWFTDWGRDTMIALPGLTLVTRRFAEAREILLTFAKYCDHGLIPNMFPDQGEKPLYNTVDASLWFFHAVSRYIAYTGDNAFIKESIYPVLKEIVNSYRLGTLFNIKMDKDGLISAGEHGQQLTWMDAKVNDWVVTPRHGKPVEINALWYNALHVISKLAKTYGDKPEDYLELAKTVQVSFNQKFWNHEAKCLFDLISENGPDPAVRPNQILAVALTYSPLDHSRQVDVVNKVWRDLYFSYGLRSLSPSSPEYRGRYMGGVVQRDGAYHQGTGWAWLIGPFITAFRRVHGFSAESKTIAERFIDPLKAHLRHHGVGSISEIFDGDPPHAPKGCYAQAWSVAEVLRTYVEDILGISPEKK
ncbi:MAG: amylo-alpha-1,6-glucosidase [Thermincola sp.]|jgi:predicted glycogen debranching enzyme|nr:amylo-alpha-1,6-glucosidase [Thermincola sp.]MDT3704699.1 amylo-alpha-1,6-glucosidase [Thermincola sp.]